MNGGPAPARTGTRAAQAAGKARFTLGADVDDDHLDAGRALDLVDGVAYALHGTSRWPGLQDS